MHLVEFIHLLKEISHKNMKVKSLQCIFQSVSCVYMLFKTFPISMTVKDASGRKIMQEFRMFDKWPATRRMDKD